MTLLSFTGVALAFPEPFRAVFGERAAIRAMKAPGGRGTLPLSQCIAISRAALPQAQWTELRLPKSPKNPVSIRFRLAGDLGDGSRNEISLDSAGRILGVHRISEDVPGARVLAAFTPLDYGEVGGPGVRVEMNTISARRKRLACAGMH